MAKTIICKIPGKNGMFKATIESDGILSLDPMYEKETCDDVLWLSPGLFDIQVNGMLGVDLAEEGLTVDMVETIDKNLAKKGVTRWCPTITTQDFQIVKQNLATIAKAIDTGAVKGAYCIHLEGHFISAEEGYRGVHMEKYIRNPNSDEFDLWQEAAKGHIGLFSLAPERSGAIPFIRKLKNEGVKVALVHHNADYPTIRSAVANGADLSSHLINGCARLINRQNNVIWSQLSIDDLWASFIPDGFHIPAPTLKTVLRAKGLDRSILVSDIVYLSGMPEGEYENNGHTVILKDGGLWVKGQGTNLLSGAAKTLDEGCSYAATNDVCSIEQALMMASVNPAIYMGIQNVTDLYPGYKGSLVAFLWNGEQLAVS